MDPLPKIDPETRSVYNGVEVSLGIAPILSALSYVSNQRLRPDWNLFLINVETIIRDRKEKNSSIEQTAQGVLTDIGVLAQYISAYCRITRTSRSIGTPVVCFYFPHYENIPRAYLRSKLPKGTEERWKVRDAVMKLMTQHPLPEQIEETKIIAVDVGRSSGWPHKDLFRDLYETRFDKGPANSMKYRKVLMISHVPLDFTLYKQFAEFTILESYTGRFKHRKQFGKKVFNDENIPFNLYTYLLLGDKWYLGSPLNNVSKKQLKSRAASEHWNVLPETSVLTSIVKMGIIPSSWFVPASI